MAKGCEYKIVRALETHPKAILWRFGNCGVVGLQLYCKDMYATGSQHGTILLPCYSMWASNIIGYNKSRVVRVWSVMFFQSCTRPSSLMFILHQLRSQKGGWELLCFMFFTSTLFVGTKWHQEKAWRPKHGRQDITIPSQSLIHSHWQHLWQMATQGAVITLLNCLGDFLYHI